MSTHAQTAQQLREEIDATLSELGATVEELAAKTAIKARLHDQVEHVKGDLEHTRDLIADRRRDLADRRRQIARHAGYAISDTVTDAADQAKATVEGRPAAAVIGAAVLLLVAWTLARRTS